MEEENVRIKLERHVWPDEKANRKRKKIFVTTVILAIVLSFGIGWLFGSFLQTPITVNNSGKYTRLDAIIETLSAQWYFGKDIENIETWLLNNAINGMIDLNGDIHTSYLTAEEVKQFNDSIDMGFVGIGVQYYMSADGYPVVERVFKNSPAEAFGVMPGDIIYIVDGVDVKGMETEEIASRVKGEEGTTVVIDFLRAGTVVRKEIIRGIVKNSAFGQILAGNVGYLEIYQFGSSTTQEVAGYLNDMKAKNVSKLVIDLRDNGGGYLNTLVGISSLLLPKDTVVIRQEYKDGSSEIGKTLGGQMTNFTDIVILVNGNTASASEVLTAALQEQAGIKVVGVKTYGKGTVQITRPFADGSALKFTTAQWMSPNGNAINGVGITPDYIVELHPVFYFDKIVLEEGVTYGFDQVDESVELAQLALDFLGYSVNRTDGYFDQSTVEAIVKFRSDYALEESERLDKKALQVLSTEIIRYWFTNRANLDTQLQKALELINE
ncbi:MAG: peptidase [Firmicutes bacterium HGW-Firmicutes-10]|jgi:carboxyl-terminal processing protease|nr:MAG: peptidase [Firmicutes bacterium HGW-Firmicutes-10]